MSTPLPIARQTPTLCESQCTYRANVELETYARYWLGDALDPVPVAEGDGVAILKEY